MTVSAVDLLRVGGFTPVNGIGTTGKEGAARRKIYHIRRLTRYGEKPLGTAPVKPGY